MIFHRKDAKIGAKDAKKDFVLFAKTLCVFAVKPFLKLKPQI